MKENDQEVVIVLACDSNMLAQTFVTIASVLEHRREKYSIVFYILFPQNEDEAIGNKYEKRLLQKYDLFSIQYKKIDNSLFNNVEQYIKHITVPTNYRLLIPDLLPQYDKCIYLDGDAYVYQDIIELWNQNVEKDYVAGVVTDSFILNESERKRYIDIYKFQYIDIYINAGVLLMNLQFLRKNNMSQMFMELINTKHFPMGDQDVINYACKRRIKLLSYKFNACPISYAYRKKLKAYIGFEEIEDAYNNPIVVHFAGANLKPWDNLTVMYAEEWWNTAKNVLDLEIEELYESAKKLTKELFLIPMLEKIEKKESCVILGFGRSAKVLIDLLHEIGMGKILCCCDNNETKWGEKYKGIECISFMEAAKKHRDCLFLNSVQSPLYQEEINNQIIDLGIAIENVEQFVEIHPNAKNAIAYKFYKENKEGIIDFERIKKTFM